MAHPLALYTEPVYAVLCQQGADAELERNEFLPDHERLDRRGPRRLPCERGDPVSGVTAALSVRLSPELRELARAIAAEQGAEGIAGGVRVALLAEGRRRGLVVDRQGHATLLRGDGTVLVYGNKEDV